MSWKESTKEMTRLEFVTRALSGKEKKLELCREYGISRPTGDKWINRYLRNEPLEDRPRTPQHKGNRTKAEIEEQIIAMRKEHPVTGSKKIKRMLENEGMAYVPCAKTIDNILHRHGLITVEATKAATPYQRYEKDEPNDMWQMDFKGHFLMKNHVRCHPLNIIDDRSRYSIRIDAHDGETTANVTTSLKSAFREYGLPKTILCDNGNPWGISQGAGFTGIEVWLMDLDILTVHIRPRHPQTQGKDERLNESFKKECLNLHEFENRIESQRIFDEYRSFYNNIRPHEALGMQTPADVYRESERKYPQKIDSWEYPAGYLVRRVRGNGGFFYNGKEIFLGGAFGGRDIGIRESHIPGFLTIEYRNFRVARLHTEDLTFAQRRIYRLSGDPRGNLITFVE